MYPNATDQVLEENQELEVGKSLQNSTVLTPALWSPKKTAAAGARHDSEVDCRAWRKIVIAGAGFCERGFVLGSTMEDGFGNNIYKVLSAAGLAVMLNRSLIIAEHGGTTAFHGHDWLRRHSTPPRIRRISTIPDYRGAKKSSTFSNGNNIIMYNVIMILAWFTMKVPKLTYPTAICCLLLQTTELCTSRTAK